MLLILLGIGFIVFSLFYFADAGLFRIGKMKAYDAVLIDEVEDEVYDNIGGTKTRFFKAFEFEDEGEMKVVRSQRPMRRITNKVGKKTRIYVDVTSRKAMEKSDVILYFIIALVLALIGVAILLGVWYIKTHVKGAVL